MTSFEEFGLDAPILTALSEKGYATPTPIQIKAIPHVLAGRDLCGIAQTGTGKTAAFALPILARLARARKPRQPRACRALVLSPTRELSSQIQASFRDYAKHLKLTAEVVFGGVPVGRQQRALAGGVDILVATPGRLIDLVQMRALDLSKVEILVLDEADQMLDLGFIHALRRIVAMVPKKRQTLFFSATMPTSISTLAAQYLDDPVEVAVAPVATTAERVAQRVMFVDTSAKPALLRAVLKAEEIDRVLVFTRTKHGADRVVRQLDQSGIAAVAIHGNKSQPQREKALAAFRAGHAPILVATDIAARGIDVAGVSHVVNYDLPNVPEAYVHRIGRTARAGAEGVAISFCNGEERAFLRDIEKLTRARVPVMPLPEGVKGSVEPQPDRAEHRPTGRSGQGRGRDSAQPRGRHGAQPRRHADAPAAASGGREPQGRPARAGGPGGANAPRHHSSGGNAAKHQPGGHAPRRPEGGRDASRPDNRRPASSRPANGGRDGSQIGWLGR